MHQPVDILNALKNAAVRLRLKAAEANKAADKRRAEAEYPGLGTPTWDENGSPVNTSARKLDEADAIEARVAVWLNLAALADAGQVYHPGPDQGQTYAQRQAWCEVMAEAPKVYGGGLLDMARLAGNGVFLEKSSAATRDEMAERKAGLEYLTNEAAAVRYRASKNPRDLSKAFNTLEDALKIAGESDRQTPTIPAEKPKTGYDRSPTQMMADNMKAAAEAAARRMVGQYDGK
jgi:hypothetical protein